MWHLGKNGRKKAKRVNRMKLIAEIINSLFKVQGCCFHTELWIIIITLICLNFVEIPFNSVVQGKWKNRSLLKEFLSHSERSLVFISSDSVKDTWMFGEKLRNGSVNRDKRQKDK